MGGQLPVTCERCDICTVTGEGTSFWNTVRHSFTINLVLAVFLREVPIRTYVRLNTTNQFVTSEGKRSITGIGGKEARVASMSTEGSAAMLISMTLVLQKLVSSLDADEECAETLLQSMVQCTSTMEPWLVPAQLH